VNATILLAFFAAQTPPEAPFQIESVKPLPALTKKFYQTSGWTGGDGAASIALGPNRTLWLFADSWIGKIENGKRVGPRMINNAVAWQDLREPASPLRFFWNDQGGTPTSLLKVEKEADAWYWPADGALIDGKLYIFCKVVRRKMEGPPGFQFDWFANELLRVDNPNEEPVRWKVSRQRLPEGENAMRLGVGCFVEGDFLYALGLLPRKENRRLENKVGLARIHQDRLAKFDGNGWEYWREGKNGPEWGNSADNAIATIPDAAPDQSIGKVRGIDGFVTIYIPLGMGPNIVARFAQKPEGPWSKPVALYHCPEKDEKVFTYAARHHPELASKDGQLIITYCRNIGDLGEHVRRPEIYFPQAVEVQLRKKQE
jgi:hypothetical protein